jgi:hypothetical protein
LVEKCVTGNNWFEASARSRDFRIAFVFQKAPLLRFGAVTICMLNLEIPENIMMFFGDE